MRVAPHNLDAEHALLGSILIDPTVLEDLPSITPDAFYTTKNRAVWQAIKAVEAVGSPLDLVTVSDALRQQGALEDIGGASYLVGLMEGTPTSVHAEYYARTILGDLQYRKLIHEAGRLTQMAYDKELPANDLQQFAESAFMALGDTQGNITTGVECAGDIVDRLIQSIEAGPDLTAIPTGFTDFDSLLAGGFRPQELITVAARPAMGKSSFALSVAMHIARSKDVLFFSKEMSKEQLMLRVLATEARVDLQRIRNRNLSPQDWNRIRAAQIKIGGLRLHIEDISASSPNQLAAIARRYKRSGDLGLVVVDYLQILEGEPGQKFQNDQAKTSYLSRSLKKLARELEVPTMVLSQLSREVEKRADKRPMLSDLRDSGAIEQDSDMVVFLYRDEYYNKTTDQQGIAEVILAKQRNGPTDTVKLQFHAQFAKFNNLAVLT